MLPLNILELDTKTREMKNYPEIVKVVEKLSKLTFKKQQPKNQKAPENPFGITANENREDSMIEQPREEN